MKKPLIILAGPTAVGKTKASIGLAKRIGAEIISADSMQVYKHMDIGTAKIMPEEMQGVRHFLIDEYEPDEEFNIVKFQAGAKQAIEEITARGHIPIIAGGTGFYIQSVLYDVDFDSAADAASDNKTDIDGNEEAKAYRAKLQERAEAGEQAVLHKELEAVDPVSAENIHPNNVKRVIRALEYYYQTGEPISRHNEEQRNNSSPYNFVYFVLNDDREKLYKRIDARVDKMFEAGLVDEVRMLRDMGYDRSYVSMQGIGYKEVLDYLDGICTLEEAVYIIKRDTRHFAKRQLTWFRRERDVTWVNRQDFGNDEAILDFMINKLHDKGIIER